MRGVLGRAVLRTVWLLVGAAIGLAALLLLVGLAQVIGGPPLIVTVLCLLPALLIGLLPGVRELEVTAARSLLAASGDLVVPSSPTSAHRLRTSLLVVIHLLLGLLAAALLFGFVPGIVLLATASLRGEGLTVSNVRVPEQPAGLAAPLALLALAGCLAASWALGLLAATTAGRLLGPTAGDRLEVALSRLAAESQYVRLARELHDGIGHALTIISIQAEGGRRVIDRNPAQTSTALSSISETARQALEELDDLLSVLRDGDARRSEPDLDQLPDLIRAHRATGMTVDEQIHVPPDLPRLVSTTAYRIVAEGLTNSSRYAGRGAVRLDVHRDRDALVVAATSPLGPPERVMSPGSGRGLAGIAERVRLFGGTVTAGPVTDQPDAAHRQLAEPEAAHPQVAHWVLRAEIPLPGRDG